MRSMGRQGRVERAVNHSKVAIATHSANFPETEHLLCDVTMVNPRKYKPTDILVTSPECKHFSQARGRDEPEPTLFDPDGPADADRSRTLMWDVPRFAEAHRYKIVIVENVVDVLRWPKPYPAGHPEAGKWQRDPSTGRRVAPGGYFRQWTQAMEKLGYKWRALFLNSQFFDGTPDIGFDLRPPQSRDRIYIVFWRKGQRAPDLDFRPPAWCSSCEKLVRGTQRFKKFNGEALSRARERGRYRDQYLYWCDCGAQVIPAVSPAAIAIDWSIVAKRIRDRDTPLEKGTMQRIRRGILRLPERPVLVPLDHLTANGKYVDKRCFDVCGEPGPTQTARQDQGLVTQVGGHLHEREGAYGRSRSLQEPLMTCHTSLDRALVVAKGKNSVPTPDDHPMGAVTTIPQTYLCDPDAGMIDLRGQPDRSHGVNDIRRTDEPLSSVCASGNHHGLIVRSFGSADGPPGKQGTLRGTGEPMTTLTAQNGSQLVVPPPVATLAYNRTAVGIPVEQPAGAITAVGPTGLIDADDVDWEQKLEEIILDSTFRMLEPHEIGRAMAFPDTYIVHGNKRDRVRQYGNAVTWPVMAAILARCVASLDT